MPSYRLRFVGQTSLPKSISQNEIDEDFSLSNTDTEEIRSRFRGVGRLGAAIQLVSLRATGRGLESFTGLPRLLLQSLSRTIGVNAASIQIASLKSLYSRPSTRYEHQRWAREYAGYKPLGQEDQQRFTDVLTHLSNSAVSIHDLVKSAEVWLFEHQYVLPSDRILRDQARLAFATQDAAAVATVRQNVPKRNLDVVLSRMFSKRLGPTGASVLEWLRTAPAKHGQRTLTETIHKVAYLKTLQVHVWDLSAIPSARREAYSQAVVNRPPYDTERLSPDRKALELCCFLHTLLYELTDVSADITARRLNDIYRFASNHVEKAQARRSTDLRAERVKVKAVLYDGKLSDKQKVAALKELITNESHIAEDSRASLVRQSLVEDETHRVSGLVNAMGVFDVRGDDSNPVLQQVKILRDLVERRVLELPTDFDHTLAAQKWHALLQSPDRKKALAALKASVMASVRKEIKGGKLWLAHSSKHRDREEQLIPVNEWQAKRSGFLSAMNLTADPDKYLDRLYEKVQQSLSELAAAVDEGRVTIDEAGHLHIPPIVALDVEPEVGRARDAIFDIIGSVQHGQLLVEIDAKSGFSEVLLGRKAKTAQELTALYGALLAHGTDNDARGVAHMIPGLQVSQISSAMRALEAQGRLTNANQRVVEFQQTMEISKLWGRGDKASADSMTVDTSRHLHSARMEYRRKQPGIGLYTHVQDSYGLFYNQPIILNDRQAASAVQGVEHHNATRREDQIKLSLLAVDTHGYTNAAMSVAKFLQFDLCVRLRQVSERMLYLPGSIHLPESLERLKTGRASVKKIKAGWDPYLRFVASIRDGRLTAREGLQRLGSAAKGDILHATADELGKMLRTIFLCDYFSKPDFRREMHALLDRGESVHLLQRAVHQGRMGTQRGRRRDELWAISGAHTLLTNAIIAWNTMKMQQVIDDWKAKKHPIEDDWVRRMGPVHFSHINFRGTIAFELDRFLDDLLQRKPAAKAKVAS